MEDKHYNPLEIVKEILTTIVVLIVVFAWLMLMQLIISFVGLSYLTLKLKTMFIVAGAVAVVFTIIWETVRLRRRKKYKSLL